MQGRQGPGGESWERPSGRPIASLNGTSKQRSIPKRPPGLTRVGPPPATPRVEKPQKETARPKSKRQMIIIISSLLLASAIVACVGSYLAANLISGLNASNGAATTAADFLSSLSKQDYAQAYKNLGSAITIQLSQDDFIRRAKNNDSCYGPVTNYIEVADSAKQEGINQSYSYTITRSKAAKTYKLQLTLQQDQDGTGTWKITDYGGDLGPNQSSTSCK